MMWRSCPALVALLTGPFTSAQYWAKSIGGLGGDHVADVALLHDSILFITGEFSNAMEVNGTTHFAAGGTDLFVARLDLAGNVQWVVTGGGVGVDRGTRIAADAGGVVVTGQFMGTADLLDSTVTAAGSSPDLFIARLDAATGGLQWLRTGGGPMGLDKPNGLALAPNGNAIVAGEFRDTASFSGQVIASMPDPLTLDPSIDVFVACYDGAGALLWLQQGAGQLTDRAVDVVCDAAGNAYVCGQFSDTIAFDVPHPNAMYGAGFLLKLDATGGEQWFRRIGGSAFNHVRDLLLTDGGELLLGGDLQGTMWFFDASPDAIAAGDPDAYFLLRASLAGDHLWHTVLGSDDPLALKAIDLRDDTIAVLGEFQCQFTDLNAFHGGVGSFIATGDQDIFIARHLAVDGSLIDAQQFGGQKSKRADGLVTTAAGDPIFCGGYEHLLVIPSDTGYWADMISVNAPCADAIFNINDTAFSWCGDPDYGRFVGLRGMGLRDGFITRGFVRDRLPYDFWRRTDTVYCDTAYYAPCIQGWSGYFQECPDSIQSCYGYQNLRIMGATNGNCTTFSWLEEELCDSMAYTGPDIDILWSNGQTTRTTTVYTTGWVWCMVTTANGCLSWTDSIYVSIDPMPVQPTISDGLGFNTNATVAQAITACAPTWIWCPYVPPGFTCTWTYGGGTVTNDSVYADIGGSYVAEFTDTLGCTNTNVVVLLLDSVVPWPNITGSSLTLFWEGDTLGMDTVSVCQGDCVYGGASFDVYVNGAIDTVLAGLTYSYAPECPTELSYTGAYNDTAFWGVQALATGWAQVGLIVGLNNGACGGSSFYVQPQDSIYLQVSPVPSILQLAPLTICPGDTLPIAASCPACDSISIMGPGVVASNTLGDTAWITTPGTYVSVGFIFGAEATCMAASWPDDVLPPQVPDLFAEPPLACPGDTVLLFTPAQGMSYQWYGPLGPIAGTNDTVMVTDLGEYTLDLIDWSGCAVSGGPVEVGPHGTPSLEVYPGQVICAGDSAMLQVVGGTAADIFWNAPLSGSGPIRYVGQGGTYSCMVVLCGDSITLTIALLQGDAEADVVEDDTLSFCTGDSLVLHGVPGQDAYLWLPAQQWTLDLPVNTPGSYALVAMDEFGCTDTSEAVVVLEDMITTPLSVEGDSVCAGEDAVLTASGSGTILWYSDPGATDLIGSGGSLPMNDATTGISVHVVQYDGACISDTLVAMLVVLPSPNGVAIAGPVAACAGDTIFLQLIGPPGTNGEWTTPAGGHTGPDLLIAPVAPGDAGSYSAAAFLGDCPGDTATMVLTVNVPVPYSLGTDTAFCPGQSLVLQLPDDFTQVAWSTGDSATSIGLVAPGSWSVQAVDPNGCAFADQIAIGAADCTIEVPNVISPNGDGVNDVLEVRGFGEPVMLVIHNRWGMKVVELHGLVVKWNGRTAENDVVPEGVYYYELLVPVPGSASIGQTGYVQVVR